MTGPHVLIYRSAELLAAACAARLLTKVVDVQAVRESASVVLTGGSIGIEVLSELAQSPARDAINWQRVDVYWGDDRFVPAHDPERNERQAREALLEHVPIDPNRVHAMPPSDGEFGDDPERGADWYAEVLRAHAAREQHVTTPAFDLVLLGMGSEGHVASIFPESPAAREDQQTVVAVRNCPKPPPTRLSLTFPAIQNAHEVWIVAAGAAKADALGLAHAGAGEVQLPVTGARGRVRTRWLLDEAAAQALPELDQPRTL